MTSILGLSYFLVAERKFDWFAVAFFSACVYFLPGFFGYSSYLTLTEWVKSSINNEAYLVMILVEIMILLSAIITDMFPKKVTVREVEQKDDIYLMTLLCMAIAGLFMMIITTGTALFNEDKQSMMNELNRWHILFYISTIIGSTLAFENKKWTIYGIFCLFIIFDTYIGFRMSFALSFISTFTLWLAKQGKRRLLICYWRQGLIAVLMVLFLFFYKQIAFAVKSGNLDVLATVLSNTSTYSVIFTNSEPFVIQSILNEVTLRHYSVGMEHLKGLSSHLILFAPQLGIQTKSFNDMFQRDLFPEVDYGMANNIWAEMLSAGGWPLLLVFVLIFIIVLKLFCIFTDTDSVVQRSCVAVMASFWAFYIHRNDISYEVSLEKRVLLVAGLCLVVAKLLKQLKSNYVMPMTNMPGNEDIQ